MQSHGIPTLAELVECGTPRSKTELTEKFLQSTKLSIHCLGGSIDICYRGGSVSSFEAAAGWMGVCLVL